MESSWRDNCLPSKPNPKPPQKFAFIKTGHKRKTQFKFPKGTRVLPLGNYLADDYPVADTIVLDALAKARLESPLKNEVRTSYDKLELKLFNSPFSHPIIGKAHKRAHMDKKEIDIDNVRTKVLLRKL